MISQDNSVALTGIALTLSPGDSTAGWEIQRSPDGISSWQTIAQLGPVSPGGGVYIDYLPLDGSSRFYQVRQVKLGWQPSSWTQANPPSGIPAQLDPGTVVAALNNPTTVVGVLLDAQAPNTKYVQRFDSNSYADPDTVDGVQSYIDFLAATNFMRVGRTSKVVHASTSANPSVVTVTSHGLTTGNVITIRGHLGNPAINGTWPVTVIDNDTFTVPVAGSGTGTVDTGHMVQLSLAIDSSGNLNVYGNIQADTFVANGTATFNGALRALGGTLARSLQHSVTGEYGDTTVNRMMLDGGDLTLLGDVGSSGTATGTQTSTTLQDTTKSWTTNIFTNATVYITSGTGSGQFRTVTSNTSNTLTVPAWTTTPNSTSVYRVFFGTNESVRLGSFSIASAPVARTTANFDNPAVGSRGWNDPDGTDNGFNTLNLTTNGITTVPAASQLYQKLGVSTEGDFVDAYDNNYTLQFRADASYDSGGNPTAVVTATVYVSCSTDSGANWTQLPGSYAVNAGGTGSGYPSFATAGFNPTVQVSGSPAHVWFRLALQLQANILDSTHHSGSATAHVYCWSGGYKTSNYATTWFTSVGSVARRGLKLLATSNGTDTVPHAFLDPLATVTSSTNAVEGEFEYVGGSTHELYARDQNQWVGLLKPRYIGASSSLGRGMTIIDTKSGLSTTSTVEASLGTINIPANTLVANGDCVRIRMRGRVIGGSFAVVAVTFGGTYVLGNAANYANNCGWWADIEVYRVGANSQKSWALGYDNGTTPPGAGGVTNREAREAEPAKTETAAITLDFRGKTGAGTLFMDSITVWCEAK